MLSIKFVNWIRALWVANGKNMSATGKIIGTGHYNVSKWLKDGRRDITIDELERYARSYRPKSEVWVTLREIEEMTEGAVVRRMHETPAEMAARFWNELFRDQEEKAAKVLANLRIQEELGLTDLISEVVHAIIVHGPRDAHTQVFKALDKAAPDHRRTKRIREAVERYIEEYQQLH